MEGITVPTTSAHKEDTIASKLHSIAQYILVGVFGLLPIVFLPGVEFSLTFTKTFVVVVAVLLALALYSFAVLRTGTFRVSLPLPVIILWLIVIAGSASAFLSGDVRDAFFGDFLEQNTVAFLATIALVVTVVTHVLTDKQRIFSLYIVLAGSTVALACFHVARLFFGVDFLSFGIFGGNQTLTPVGTWNDLAIFFGLTVLLAIVALEQLALTKHGRWLFAAVVVVALGMLTVINFSPVWFILLVVSLIVLIYSLARDRMTPAWLQGTSVERPLSALSLGIAGVVFVVSFVMIAGGSVIGGRISEMTGVSYVEVRPSLQATTDIVRDTYRDHALFGIGPNKFVDAWRLHRDPSLNSTIFWNTDFVAGVGYIPSFFVTMGVVGGLLWMLFFGLFIVAGIRMLLNAVSPDRTWYFIGTSAFVTGLYVWGLSVIYVPGAMLILLAALCTGLVLAARNAIEPHRERTISLIGDRRSGFILVSVVMIVVIMAMSALYTVGRHYASAYVFSQSERALVVGDVATSRQRAEEANMLMSDDKYLRRSAEIEYTELITTLNLPADTANLEQRFRDALRNSITSAGRAVALDGTDANNWGVLGAIFSAVVPLRIDGAYDRAKEALTKARDLDPQNPIRTLMLARLAFGNGNIEEARTLMNDAIRQKPDYVDAAFMLSQLEISAGNVDGAINSTIRIIQLEPQNPARYFQLGVLELAKGDVERGALALEAAIELDPQYANARYYLAFAYDRLGKGGDAKAQLEKVLETNRDNQEVADLIGKLTRGEKITEVPPPVQAPTTDQTKTLSEGGATVTQDPNTPFLTPVNPVPEAPRGE
jgi:tetratricopeptide (TPR) repeat protein